MVTLRPADAYDSRALWEWRNDPVARAASLDTREIPWDDHVAWFASSLLKDARLMLIGVAAANPPARVGVVRFDFDTPGSAIVSITVAPAARGRGIGQELLRTGIEYVQLSRGRVVLKAQIRASNRASLTIFERAGFVRSEQVDDVISLEATREP